MSGKRKAAVLLLLAAAAVCVMYGATIYNIRSGTAFYAVWFALAAFCALLALAVRKGLWARLSRGFRRTVLVCLTLLIALFVTVEGLILSGFDEKGEAELDYIIVLGAQVREDGPSYVLMRRLRAAEEYLAQNPRTLCIVSGGQGANEPFTEAEGMADFLISDGISPDRIILENNSSSTVENIRNSMAFIPSGSRVGVVTNNFHVFRAVETAKRCGLENACGIAADLHPYFLPNSMLREFLAVMKFYLQG